MTSSPDDKLQNAAPASRPSDATVGIFGASVRLAVPLGILLAGGFAYAILSVERDEAKSPPVEEQAIRTRVTELRTCDYPVIITTHGVVQAHNRVTLSAQVSGQITRISRSFEAGAYFTEGEVLVELDDRDYITALAVATAERLGAEAALQLAKLNHERAIKLFGRNVGTEADVSQALAARSQAAAVLDTAVAKVEQAKRDLARTVIYAPFDGRVREKNVGLGQSVGTGTALGDVFAVDYAEVRLPISGRELQFLDLPELANDPPVKVELRDAINQSDTSWQAEIVRTEGVLDEDSLELFAIARIDDPFGRKSGHPPLRIGQPVVGEIAGKVLTGVIAVPRVAVRQLDQVFLIDKHDLTLMPKKIVPIWSDQEHVIVQDPLIRDGMLLSTTHLVYAPTGAKVEIIPDPQITTASANTDRTGNVEPVTN